MLLDRLHELLAAPLRLRHVAGNARVRDGVGDLKVVGARAVVQGWTGGGTRQKILVRRRTPCRQPVSVPQADRSVACSRAPRALRHRQILTFYASKQGEKGGEPCTTLRPSRGPRSRRQAAAQIQLRRWTKSSPSHPRTREKKSDETTNRKTTATATTTTTTRTLHPTTSLLPSPPWRGASRQRWRAPCAWRRRRRSYRRQTWCPRRRCDEGRRGCTTAGTSPRGTASSSPRRSRTKRRRTSRAARTACCTACCSPRRAVVDPTPSQARKHKNSTEKLTNEGETNVRAQAPCSFPSWTILLR